MKNLDKIKSSIGAELYNHIGSLSESQLKKQLSELRSELKNTKDTKSSRYAKLKSEEFLILYRLERTDEFMYKNGGTTEDGSLLSVFDNLKKGDKIRMSYGDAIVGKGTKDLVVKNRTRVGVGKSWESDKITFTNLNNPSGVKLYGYKRMNNNAVSFAIGDMGIWDVKITKLGQYQMGGNLNTFTYTIGGL